MIWEDLVLSFNKKKGGGDGSLGKHSRDTFILGWNIIIPAVSYA